MYTGKLYLTNPSRCPLSLTNLFGNHSFQLEDAVREAQHPDVFCSAANVYGKYGYRWAIDADNEEETRLICTDCLNNVFYLIAKKKSNQTKSMDLKMKKKIMETLQWYIKADDHESVAIARENGKVLFNLLEEIVLM